MRAVAGTAFEVFELCLGTNVFGWTADEEASFAVLDAYVAAGGNFIDTADSYSAWVEGHCGGESEDVIGRWLASRGCRDDIVLATKVGSLGGLGAANIAERLEASLRRLNTDRIDIYYAHRDDPQTALEETMDAFDALVQAGKVVHVAASNYEPDRLAAALAASGSGARFVALSPHYNLLDRSFESTLAPICESAGLSCVPYFGLAKGFLTGKYREHGAAVSDRGRLDGSAYLDDRGLRVLDVLDAVSAAHETTPLP